MVLALHFEFVPGNAPLTSMQVVFALLSQLVATLTSTMPSRSLSTHAIRTCWIVLRTWVLVSMSPHWSAGTAVSPFHHGFVDRSGMPSLFASP
jgi:hypothetical protein